MSIEEERQKLKQKFLVYGYERGRNILNLSPDFLNIFGYLRFLPENKKSKKYKCLVSDIVLMTKKFFDKHFMLHNVPSMSYDGFQSLLSKYNDFHNGIIDVSNLDDLISAIEGSVESISPFEIPIELVDGHSMIGEISKQLLLVDNEKFLKEYPVVFSNITLGNNVTLLSAATTVHEIVHSQVDSVKGACTNYHNCEVLSIFMEKLFAYEQDSSGELLKTQEKMRNRYLFENICLLSEDNLSRELLLEASVYISSTLKADYLFDKYIKGDVDTQTNILNGIQNVFDGKSTVEELLDKTNVDLENSTKAFSIKHRNFR